MLTEQQLASYEHDGIAGVKHMLFGLNGGVFTHISTGAKVRVLRTETGESILNIVVKSFNGERPNEMSDEQIGDINEFVRGVAGDQVREEPDAKPPERIDLSGFPANVMLLEASKLTTGTEVVLENAEGFMSAVFMEVVEGRGSVIGAAKRLDQLMQGKTALCGGAAWRVLEQNGMLSALDAEVAGGLIWSVYFIQQPTLVGTEKKEREPSAAEALGANSGCESDSSHSDHSVAPSMDDIDDDSSSEAPPKPKVVDAPKPKAAPPPKPKKAKASTTPPAANLAAFVPRDGSLSALATARVLFEEASVRAAAGCEELPDAAAAAGREWRYEQRADLALGDLWQIIGRAVTPAKPPKHEVGLQQAAEEIHTAVRKAARGGGGGGGSPDGSGGIGAGFGVGMKQASHE